MGAADRDAYSDFEVYEGFSRKVREEVATRPSKLAAKIAALLAE